MTGSTGAALMENTWLVALLIQHCDIDSQGVKDIKNLLLRNKTLQRLVLDENNIGDQGTRELSKYFNDAMR